MDGEYFSICGTADHDSYIHKRLLQYVPGKTLEVVDELTPKKPAIESISWFNVNGEFEAEVEGNSVVFYFPNREVQVRVNGSGDLITPVRGQRSPLRGWGSKIDGELVPVWNFGFRREMHSKGSLRVKFEIVDAISRTSDLRN